MSNESKKRVRRSRANRKRNSLLFPPANRNDPLGRRMAMESLEQRCLLSVTPFYSAKDATEPFDLTLRLDGQGETQRLLLVESPAGDEVASLLVNQVTEAVRIEGSFFDDILRVAFDPSILPVDIQFSGGPGEDVLHGPAADTVWTISGPDAGRLGSAGTLTFDGVEYLAGSADNEDLFILEPGGGLTGGLHGGARGYDTLVIAGGRFADVQYQATGPDSGFVILNGSTLQYAGLEPITDNSIATDRVLTAPGTDDTIRITDAASQQISVEAVGAMETHVFAQPTRSLTINAGGGNDTIQYELGDVFSDIQTSVVIIDGGAGTDTLDLSGRIIGMTVLHYSNGTSALVDNLGNYVLVRNVESFTGQNGEIQEAGIPAWLEQGPGTIRNGQVQGIPNQPVAGAVQAIAQHPHNDDVLFIGTAAGGVWRTTDGGLTWTPMTDQFPSLAIGDVKISHLDASGSPVTAVTPLSQLVVYAGTGKFSNSGDGGSNIGILKTTNGGRTWSLVGANEMAGLPLTAVLPVSANTVVAAALDKSVVSRGASGSYSFNRDRTLRYDVPREGGVFRSTDGGATWENLSELALSGLSDGPASDLVADPGNVNTLYAASPGVGLFRSTDGGASWTTATGNLPHVPDALRIVLSVSGAADAGTGNRPIYAAMIHSRAAVTVQSNAGSNTLTVDRPDIFATGQKIHLATVDVSGGGFYNPAEWEEATIASKAGNVLTLTAALAHTIAVGRVVHGGKDRVSGVYRSADHGATWTKMAFLGDAEGGVNPGGQAMKNFALLASRTDPNVVYAAGDRQTTRIDGKGPSAANPNASGATDWVGRIFRGTFAAGGGSWTSAVGTNAGGTAPHADAREMVFDNDGNLLQGDDGGIYRLQNPGTPGQVWQSMIGTLRATEVRSVAYDPVNNVIGVGSQDVGSSIQVGGLPDPVDANGDLLPDDGATRFVWQQTPISYSGGGSTGTMKGDGNTQTVIVTTTDRDQRDNDGDTAVDEADEAGGVRVLRFTMANTWTSFARHEFDAAGSDVTPLPTNVGGVWTNSWVC